MCDRVELLRPSSGDRLFTVLVALFLPLLSSGCSISGATTDPPLPLLLANVQNTDLTVVVEVTGGERSWQDRIYETWQVHARVLRVFKGSLKAGEMLQYDRTVEVGLWSPEPGDRYLVSFEEREGRFLIPDVAYHFASSPRLERRLSRRL